jgi:Ca2+-binding RTX toxin-like protein
MSITGFEVKSAVFLASGAYQETSTAIQDYLVGSSWTAVSYTDLGFTHFPLIGSPSFNGDYLYDRFTAQGFVASTTAADGTKILSINFRGTAGWADLAVDLANGFSDFEGHAEEFNDLLSTCFTYATNNGFDEILFSGHSLGGAVAEYFYNKYSVQQVSFELNCITIGSPSADIDTGLSTTPFSDLNILNFGNSNDPVFNAEFPQRLADNRGDVLIDLPNLSEGLGSDSNPVAIDEHGKAIYSFSINMMLESKLADKYLSDPFAFRTTVGDIPLDLPNPASFLVNDSWFLGANRDFALGGRGNDSLQGGGGSDLLDGGVGNDLIYGNAGADYLAGGHGADSFILDSSVVITEASNGVFDTVVDYNYFQGDDIRITLNAPVSAPLSQFVRLTLPTVIGGNVDLQIDTDGAAGPDSWKTLVRFEGGIVGNSVDVNVNDTLIKLAVPTPQTSWSITPQNSIISENGGSITFTITRVNTDAAETVYASTVRSFGSENNGDYTGQVGVPLTFAAGVHTATFTINLLNDGIAEGYETFGVILTPTSNPASLPIIASASYTIVDDDITGNATTTFNSSDNFAYIVGAGNGYQYVDMLGGTDTAIVDFSGATNAVYCDNYHTSILGVIRDYFDIQSDLTSDSVSLRNVENVVVMGGSGNDTLEGGAGNDVLDGGPGNDRLIARVGNDQLSGGGGNDILYVGGGGADAIDGGAGFDILVLERHTLTSSVVFGHGISTVIGEGTTIEGIEAFEVTTGSGNDHGTFIGAGKGYQYFDGNTGTDTAVVDFSGATGQVYVYGNSIRGMNIGSGTSDRVDLYNIENIVLIGGSGSDALLTDGGNFTLISGAGNDTLQGGAGNDTLDGGAGNDTAVFSGAFASYAITWNAATDQYKLINSTDGTDTVTAVENFQFSDGVRTVGQLQAAFGPNTINGDASNNILVGTTGVDQINGLAGNDTLDGGSGIDALHGGAGEDWLEGGLGADLMDGGAGDDAANYYASIIGVTVNLTTGTGSGGLAEGDTLIGIERVNGSNLRGDDLTGDRFANYLAGYGGNDIIDAMAGNDWLIGGSGDDWLQGGLGADVMDGGTGDDAANYYTSAAGVIVNLTTGIGAGGLADGDTLSGIERVNGSDLGNDDLTGDAFDNLLAGYGRNDIIDAMAGNDWLFGGAGDDWLQGGLGADVMDGGAGDDAASYYNSAAGVTVNLTSGTGIGGFADGDTLIGIERVNGSNVAGDSLTGDAFDNYLAGYGRNDIIDARAGNDWLMGGSGDDWLEGGLGADVMDGGTGDDAANYYTSAVGVTVNLTTGTASGGLADGDTLAGIERVNGSNLAGDSLTGDAFGNYLAGYGRNDIIDALAGNDWLIGGAGEDWLQGGLGADVMDGGTGDDAANYYNSATAVTVNLTAGTGVGGLADGDTLIGIERVNGSNLAGDTITGDAVANFLGGYGGNDTLEGGGGNDFLLGGTGTDTFRFTSLGFGQDQVLDFQDTLDRLSFSTLVADDVLDFTITGNGTASVTLTLTSDPANVIKLAGAAPITITNADLDFA